MKNFKNRYHDLKGIHDLFIQFGGLSSLSYGLPMNSEKGDLILIQKAIGHLDTMMNSTENLPKKSIIELLRSQLTSYYLLFCFPFYIPNLKIVETSKDFSEKDVIVLKSGAIGVITSIKDNLIEVSCLLMDEAEQELTLDNTSSFLIIGKIE